MAISDAADHVAKRLAHMFLDAVLEVMRITRGSVANADRGRSRVSARPLSAFATEPYGLALVRGLFGEWGVVRRWGRIGAQGRVRTGWHGTREAGEAELARMTKAKWRRGYR